MSNDSPDSKDTHDDHARADPYRVEYTDGSNPPSLAVVKAVATLTDQDPTDLVPLYDVVDPKALDALFQRTRSGDHRVDGAVSFRYQGYDVTVKSYGIITIQTAAADGDSATETTGN